jgi:Ca2+-binding RTX toxin-like protein
MQPTLREGATEFATMTKIFGSVGNDLLIGTDLHEEIFGVDGNDILIGGKGRDKLFGDAGIDWLQGGDGDDELTGGTGADQLDGGDGFDYIRYQHSSAGVTISLLTGAASGGDATGDKFTGIEAIEGSQFRDWLEGNNGDNHIWGDGGNDTVYGLDGNDWLLGGDGHDALYGGANHDLLVGGAGNDFLYGGDGVDVLSGGEGPDAMDGGAGKDRASYDDSTVGVKVDLQLGRGWFGSAEGDQLYSIEYVQGSGHNDTLIGSVGDDTLVGEKGDDSLTGSTGQDTLEGGEGRDVQEGGEGNDLLIGGLGADTLSGGLGGDTFKFVNLADSKLTLLSNGLPRTHDVITDFNFVPPPVINLPPGGLGLGNPAPQGGGLDPDDDVVQPKTAKTNDTIDLSGIDANAALAGDQAFTFIGTNAFTQGVVGQVRIEATSVGTWVYAETTGDGSVDFAVFLQGFTATNNLMNGDFLIL